jgi:hypothetical protein
MSSDLPASLDRLTPGWLTEALAPAFPGIEVTAAEVRAVLNGSACKAKVSIESTGNDRAPASVLVKGSFTEGLGEDVLARQWLPLMAALNAAEVRFYREDASRLGDRTAACYFAQASGLTSVLVLEDLNSRPHGRFGAFDNPLNAAEMADVLGVLASLHASRWQDPVLATNPLPDGMLDGGMLDGFLSEVNWDQQMARPRGERVPAELADHGTVSSAIRRVWAAKRSGPATVIHGDPHIGNVFFDQQGAGLLDWQLATSGHWAADVVYAVASAMSIEDRRSHDQDLLRHYLDRLASHGVVAPRFADAWTAYRAFALWGFVAFLTPGQGVQGEDYNATVGERHAVAAVDLESLEALEPIEALDRLEGSVRA